MAEGSYTEINEIMSKSKLFVLEIIISVLLVSFSLIYETRDNKQAGGVDAPTYRLQWGWPLPFLQDDVARGRGMNKINFSSDHPLPINFLADVLILYLLIQGGKHTLFNVKKQNNNHQTTD